jgi:hypothetical protein
MQMQEQQAQEAEQEAKEYIDCLKTEQEPGWCDYLYGIKNVTMTDPIGELGSVLTESLPYYVV